MLYKLICFTAKNNQYDNTRSKTYNDITNGRKIILPTKCFDIEGILAIDTVNVSPLLNKQSNLIITIIVV